MYVKLWLQAINSLLMTVLAFRTWLVAGTYGDAAANVPPEQALAMGLMAGIATWLAVYTTLNLMMTAHYEVGDRRKHAKWAARDRAKHQKEWDAAAEASLNESRKRFVESL